MGQLKRAPMKKDMDKLLTLLSSFVKDLTKRKETSDKKTEDHAHFLKKMAETDEEAVSVLSAQNRLMAALGKDGEALMQFLHKIKNKSTSKQDDFDMDADEKVNSSE